MAVHHGGKVGKAGKTLASKSSSKQSKSKAGTTLANGSITEYACVYGNSGNFQEQRKEI